MALRLFADHCISKVIIKSLRSDGHEVLRLRDHLPVESIALPSLQRARQGLGGLDGRLAGRADANQRQRAVGKRQVR